MCMETDVTKDCFLITVGHLGSLNQSLIKIKHLNEVWFELCSLQFPLKILLINNNKTRRF